MNTHIDSVENRAIIGYLLFVALKRGHVRWALQLLHFIGNHAPSKYNRCTHKLNWIQLIKCVYLRFFISSFFPHFLFLVDRICGRAIMKFSNGHRSSRESFCRHSFGAILLHKFRAAYYHNVTAANTCLCLVFYFRPFVHCWHRMWFD